MDTMVSPRATTLRELVGVRPLISDALRERLLAQIRLPEFPWTTGRHKLYPTTDYEVRNMPWLEAETARLLRSELCPSLARLFHVDASRLHLRDQFIVKYSAAAGEQAALEMHHDESAFSFVVQLNAHAEFAGGGTLFEHADDALSAPPGHCLLFCGYTRHSGLRVSAGERYILTGFVDYRAPASDVRPFYGDLAGALPRPHGAGSEDFPSPHLLPNLERLRAAFGADGAELLRLIAHGAPALPHVDTRPLARRCAAYLESGEVPDERFYLFLQRVVGTD